MPRLLRRLFNAGRPGADWAPIAAWAAARGAVFKRSRDGKGFVVEGVDADAGWRLEWGPPQRNYIVGAELRLRRDGVVPAAIQMLVMTRALLESLERVTFDKFVEFNQTHIDHATPEELRWLAMFPRAPIAADKRLALAFGALAADPQWINRWLRGTLAEQLAVAAESWLADGPPFVLMTLKRRVYLRLQMPEPDLTVIDAAAALFDSATRQAAETSARGEAKPARQPGPR